jgi:chaperonin GroES
MFTIDEILMSENLTVDMDDEELDEIADTIIAGYEADCDSRSDWEERQDDYMKLAMQAYEEKTFPWKGAANVKFPLLSTAAMQFSARAYPALVPGINLVKGKITGYDTTGMKLGKADRIGRHMSYQLTEEMEGWEEDMDRLCVSLPILGTMFKKTYYNPSTGQNCSELIYPKDLVVDYWAKDISSAQRVTHKIYLSDNDILERVRTGVYKDCGHLSTGVEKQTPMEDELHGLSRPDSEFDPHEILEQHTYLDLDGDGYAEPYIVTVHLAQGKTLRIVARFDEDGVYENEGEIYRIEAINYFTKFGFIPNPDGSFYDIGFGQLLSPLNESINTIINQLLDSGTLSVTAGGFISKGIRLKGGDHSFRPFEWKSVNTTGDDLRKGIFPLPVREPSQVLFSLLGMMVESGEKLASVTDMVTGQNPGQNQPATTSMAVLEQGLKVFTSIYKRLYRSLKMEYKKLFYLNSKYLPDEVYFRILDEGHEQQEVIAREDYDMESADVQPYADPNIASDTMKMIKAQALLELLPLGTLNPMEVTKRVLMAQDQPDIEGIMMPPPQGPSPEEMEAQRKAALDEAKMEIEKERIAIDRMKVEAAALLNLAKAKDIGDAGVIREAQAHLDALRLRFERDDAMKEANSGNQQSGMGGMAQTPGNGGSIQNPGAAQGGPAGPLG